LVLLPKEDSQQQAEIAQQQADKMLRRVDELHQELTTTKH
jgi:hypothetical protein